MTVCFTVVTETRRDVDAQDYDDFDDFTTSFEGCEYFYVWNGNEWLVSDRQLGV